MGRGLDWSQGQGREQERKKEEKLWLECKINEKKKSIEQNKI